MTDHAKELADELQALCDLLEEGSLSTMLEDAVDSARAALARYAKPLPVPSGEVPRDLPESERRMYPALARIVTSDPDGDTVFTLLGYTRDLFSVPTERIPFSVKPDDKVHAQANKGAEDPSDVRVTFLSTVECVADAGGDDD